MITEFDLQEAIAECQGVRNPNANTCIKLAAFLTIQKELYGGNDEKAEVPLYSYDSAPTETIGYYGDTEFAQLVEGRKLDDIFPIMDELMSTVQVVQPRLYDAVIRKIKG